MCERTCPNCGSNEHYFGAGIIGVYIDCTGCGTTLAWRASPEAALISMTEDEADAWAAENTGVLPGAEAKDPKDDALYRRATPRKDDL